MADAETPQRTGDLTRLALTFAASLRALRALREEKDWFHAEAAKPAKEEIRRSSGHLQDIDGYRDCCMVFRWCPGT